MNTKFEKEFQDLAKTHDALFEEDLNALRGYKVAFDAELLLSKVTRSNPLKSLQEGHASLDAHV